MKYAESWLRPLVDPEIPIHWIRAGEPYHYL